MAIALIDTKILIDWLDGVSEAEVELDYYSDIAISTITYMEFVVGLRKRVGEGVISTAEFQDVMEILSGLPIIQIDRGITEKAIDVRATSLLGSGPKIKLPDAIIFATAAATSRYMVTRDPKGFVGPHVRIPYQIQADRTVTDVNRTRPT